MVPAGTSGGQQRPMQRRRKRCRGRDANKRLGGSDAILAQSYEPNSTGNMAMVFQQQHQGKQNKTKFENQNKKQQKNRKTINTNWEACIFFVFSGSFLFLLLILSCCFVFLVNLFVILFSFFFCKNTLSLFKPMS